MAAAVSVDASPTGVEHWFYGPRADLLLGAGVAWIASIPLLIGFAWVSGISEWSAAEVATVVLLVSVPHYGATILRVYEHRRDRRRYVLFASWATLVLGGLFVAGLHSALIVSLLFTAYATWSPWHFSGQN